MFPESPFLLMNPLPESPTAQDLLAKVLDMVRKDGWDPSGWGLSPPWCLGQCIYVVVAEEFFDGGRRSEMIRRMRGLLDSHCREGFLLWELEEPRTLGDVEFLLVRAIDG